MADIVERLREIATEEEHLKGAMESAADEIERLRAALSLKVTSVRCVCGNEMTITPK